MMRDVGTLVLENVLRGRATVQRHDLAPQCRRYCAASEAGADTHLGCLWEPLSTCRSPHGPGSPSLLDADVHEGLSMQITDVPAPPQWDAWIAGGSVWWETTDGHRAVQGPSGEALHAARTSMLRSLLAAQLWRPRPHVAEAVAALEQHVLRSVGGAAAALHPMLVLHVRGTDKSYDYGIMDQVRGRFPGKAVPYEAYGAMIRALENSTGLAFRTVLLLSDQLDLWHRRRRLRAYLRLGGRTRFLINPHWPSAAALLENPTWLGQGHGVLQADIGAGQASIYEFHRQLLADRGIAIAGAHGDSNCYIIGCGSSGVSQMVAQLVGRRAGVEAAWRSLWEEDFLPGWAPPPPRHLGSG